MSQKAWVRLTAVLRSTAPVAFFAVAVPPAVAAPLCPGLAGVQPTPESLQERVAEAFDVAPEAARNSVVRCAGDRLMACVGGANLNCGLANTSRDLPGAAAWCRDHPNSDVIPMSATGHDTIYAWRCSGGFALAGETVVIVDSQGYDAENWRPLR